MGNHRHNNRTERRAHELLEVLPADSHAAMRIGARLDAVEQERVRHLQRRKRLLKLLRDELNAMEGDDGSNQQDR